MKLYELRQIIREEISNVGNPPPSGIISFGQLKRAVIKSYAEFGSTGEELNEARNINGLVNVLHRLGFNGKKAYDFIFDSILT